MERLDVVSSGKVRVKVLVPSEKVAAALSTALTGKLRNNQEGIVFVVKTEGQLPIDSWFVSYEGLELLSDHSNYESVDIEPDEDSECSYCGDYMSLDQCRCYTLEKLFVFKGHEECLKDFCEDVTDLLFKEVTEYAVSSGL